MFARHFAQELLEFGTGPATQTPALIVTSVGDMNVPANSGYRRRWFVQAGPNANPRLRTVTIRVIPDNPDMRVGADFTVTTVLRRW